VDVLNFYDFCKNILFNINKIQDYVNLGGKNHESYIEQMKLISSLLQGSGDIFQVGDIQIRR
jgi:hypothetical protein